ncbi:PQQ-dependent sugar dehydrogenase [Catellatospora aurea]|uniref:PQQ-dependent sugar dehydrogenase n=1 Tax=Catellatospora aurea TaxID=1337874 RepID=A0ABW2GRR0_9ACTN
MNNGWRAGALGTSLLSAVLMFGTAAAPAPVAARAAGPAAPLITEPEKDNRLLSAADVHMETRAMQNNDAGDAHLCTDWEIWAGNAGSGERVWFDSCASGTGRVHVHLGDGVFENSFTGRKDLIPDKNYTLRVRHRDASGAWSAYSTRPFKTDVERKPLPGAGDWKIHQPGFVVEEVTGDLALPVNIAMVPNFSGDLTKPLFYVTELYGRVRVVTGDFKKHTYADDLLDFDPSAQFPGTGEMGVTGIVIEPKTGDLFVSMLYKDDGDLLPKIVRFHSEDGGLTAATKTTIFKAPGEEQSTSHQISNLTIGPDGKLYVHMGDGFIADTAEDMDSFRGKVLRMNLDGTAPSDNPFYKGTGKFQAKDYIWAYGLRNPFGGAWRQADGQHYSVENGPSVNDRFARITKGGRYHWTGGASGLTKNALYNWKETQGPVGITFTEPSVYHAAGFPQEKYNNAFVSLSGPTYASGPQRRGKKIVEFSFNEDGSVDDPKTLIEYTGSGKTSVGGMAPGPDGLYFTTLYTKIGDATDSGAKILRVRYVRKDTGSPVTLYSDSGFKGDPKGLGTGIFDATAFGKVKDNTASSLRVAGGYRVVACDSPATAPDLGSCRYFGPGEHGSLGDFNDKLSSLAVFGGPVEGKGVLGYGETGLKGTAQPLGAGMHESVAGELTGGENTSISSLKVGAGYRLIACDKDRSAAGGALGVCRILGSGEHATVGALNDKISLIGVVGPPLTVFSEAKAKGKSQSFETGVYEGTRGELAEVGDNAITSLRLEPGYRAVACAGDGSTGTGVATLGRCRSFPPGEHTLTGTDLDENISLLLVSGEPVKGANATAYADQAFKGGKSGLGLGIFEASRGDLDGAGNDNISSLQVAPGHRAVACEHGTKPVVLDVGICRYYKAGDVTFVGADVNDKFSLIAVDKVGGAPAKR